MTKASYFGKLNSTLGSVVPLAVFVNWLCFPCFFCFNSCFIPSSAVCVFRFVLLLFAFVGGGRRISLAHREIRPSTFLTVTGTK